MTLTITREELEAEPKYSFYECLELEEVSAMVDCSYDFKSMCFLTSKKVFKPEVSIEKIRYWKEKGFRYARKTRQIKKNAKNWCEHLLASIK